MNLLRSIASATLAMLLTGTSFAQEGPSAPQPVPEPTPNPAPEPADADRRIDAALASFSDEPSLPDLATAALGLADADTESASHWMAAPNLAAILPKIRFVGDYDEGRDEALDRYQDEPDRWGADTDRGLGFQLSAEWQLGELVFNSDEVRVWDALADRAERREALLRLLVSQYYERRRLQVRLLLAPPAGLVERAEARLRIDELTAGIDALTGGLLSRTLEKRRRKDPRGEVSDGHDRPTKSDPVRSGGGG